MLDKIKQSLGIWIAADQIIFSFVNLAFNVYIGNKFGAERLGEFASFYAIAMLITGFSIAFVTDSLINLDSEDIISELRNNIFTQICVISTICLVCAFIIALRARGGDTLPLLVYFMGFFSIVMLGVLRRVCLLQSEIKLSLLFSLLLSVILGIGLMFVDSFLGAVLVFMLCYSLIFLAYYLYLFVVRYPVSYIFRLDKLKLDTLKLGMVSLIAWLPTNVFYLFAPVSISGSVRSLLLLINPLMQINVIINNFLLNSIISKGIAGRIRKNNILIIAVSIFYSAVVVLLLDLGYVPIRILKDLRQEQIVIILILPAIIAFSSNLSTGLKYIGRYNYYLISYACIGALSFIYSMFFNDTVDKIIIGMFIANFLLLLIFSINQIRRRT